MSSIKTREVIKGNIKTLNKKVVVTQKTKDNIVNVKQKSENATTTEDRSVNEYAINKITNTVNAVVVSSEKIKQKGNESIKNTKNNIIKTKSKIKSTKTKLIEKRNLKNTTKSIKTSQQVTKKVATESIKSSQQAIKLARETAKKTYQGVKLAIKATTSSIKAIIAGSKALISALFAGGWIAAIIIIICCLIGLLCSSVFGIFLSNEDVEKNSITINDVVREMNNEVSAKISNIQQSTRYDECIITSNQAEWKIILSIYIAKMSNGDNKTEFLTFNDNQAEILKKIFWDINEITYKTTEEIKDNKNSTIIYITINSKSLEQIMQKYNFNFQQKKQIAELLSDKYNSLWMSLIYGTSNSNSNMVQIALSQVGNIGGQPYWSWYGFSSRVEWCAVFVSWVANQAGYIESGTIPKFSVCEAGANWFKSKGKWKSSEYIPKPGDLIFFDWQEDKYADHVGIVEFVKNNTIYTIEGNLDNEVKKNQYNANSNSIYGFGTIFN